MDASHVLNRFNVQAPGFFASQEDADDDDDESLWELSTTVSQDDWSEQVEADEPALQEDASQISSLKAAAAQAFDQGIRSGAFVWAMGLIRENPPSTADEDECMSESGRNLKVEVAATLLKGSADGTLRTALEELRPRPEPLDDPTQNLGPAERELQGAPEPEPAPLSSLLSEARRSLCRALESGLLARAVAAQREPPPALEARRRARGAEISAASEPEPSAPAACPSPTTPSRRSRVIIGAARPVDRAGAAEAPQQAAVKRTLGPVRGQGLSKSSPTLVLAPLDLKHPRSPNGWSSTKVVPPPVAGWIGTLQARAAAANVARGASAMMMDLGLEVAAGAPVPPGGPLRAVAGLRALAKVASEGSLSSPGCFAGSRSPESGRPLWPPAAHSRKKAQSGGLPALRFQRSGPPQGPAAGWAAHGPRSTAWVAST